MRSGDLITANATTKAVQQLAATPGVVAVNASCQVSSMLECRASIPFIGATAVHNGSGEKGDQAIVAVIDDGIDPFHHAFLDEDLAHGGKSRIDLYWDQKDPGTGAEAPTASRSPDGAAIVARYGLKGGMLYAGSDIDALMAQAPPALRQNVGHGTAVASIAAGRCTGQHSRHFSGGVAPQARIIAIRYDATGVGYFAGHINALELIDRRAMDLGLPVVVNISNGINCGAHNGTAPLELKCTEFTETSQKPDRVVVKSAGNERNTGRHAQFTVTGADRQLRWNSRSKPDTDGKSAPERLELYFGTHNEYEFRLQTPERTQWYTIPVGVHIDELLDTRNRLNARYVRYPAEPTRKSQLSVVIAPGEKDAVQSGVWTLYMRPLKMRDADEVHAWLELHDTRDVKFMDNVDLGYTITVPGTSEDVITVAAIAAEEGGLIYADGSKGPTLDGVMKPDIVAPGIAIAAAQAGTEKDAMPKGESGTSFAAPHVAGTIALALSAFRKKPPRDPQRTANQSFMRFLLLETSRHFRFRGDAESGFGQLDAEAFFQAVRTQQQP